MWIVLQGTLVVSLAILTAAPGGDPPAFGQDPQRTEVGAGAEKAPTSEPCQISDLPLILRPPITLQKALEVAEAYVLRENIDISNHYLLLVRAKPLDRVWFFRWAIQPEGEGEVYIDINVSWEGEASLVKTECGAL